MQKKTIFITGSGSGIGKLLALTLAKKGHTVIATTHTQKDAQELRQIAKVNHLPLESFVLDITKANDREKILQHEIDVLINNAGIGETGSLAEIEMNKVRQTFEVNVFGAFELTQLALRGMLKKDTGTIIFISSLLGRVTSPFFGPYSMSKFALSSGAEMLRNEVSQISDSVHVALVEPGAFHTGFNQKVMATKYQWMNQQSYFYAILEKIKKDELRQFRLAEQSDLTPLINKIAQVAEAKNPPLRSVAPWWQGLGVRLLRATGR